MSQSGAAWYRSINSRQWKSLVAAQLGWMLDAMDVMLYAFALGAIQREFGLTSAEAGALASVTLVASAFGGITFGVLADRIGRAKALMYSILLYSIFTALTATAGTVAELVLWRGLVGIGMGGEWSAGSVLVSETWPPEHRGKAIGIMQSGWAIGYIFAAILAAAILPAFGWRVLFLLGILPAVFVLWIRRNVPEPEIWLKERALPGRKDDVPFHQIVQIFRPPLVRKTLSATIISTCVLFAYWGLFTWMPSFLSRPLEQGGAGLGIVKSSTWIIPMQIGAFLGYISFGFFADRFGRRPVFLSFLIAAAVLVPVYGQLARHDILLLFLGPLIGFFGHGYFSVFGVMLAELFPTHVRGTAQGLTYNIGRAFSALAPFTIGALADEHGIGSALALTSAFFLLGAGLIFLLPETRGADLTRN
ncbi:MAG: MFS transporter [Bacteroidota bacterium]